jgi:hypothetical protein
LWQHSGWYLSRYGRRSKPHCAGVFTDRSGFIDECSAIETTEGKGVVRLNAIAAWAAFHNPRMNLSLILRNQRPREERQYFCFYPFANFIVFSSKTWVCSILFRVSASGTDD